MSTIFNQIDSRAIGVIDVYSEYENSENIYMNKSGSCNIGKDDTQKTGKAMM